MGAVRYARFAHIDDGLVVRLSEHCVWLMPHGGHAIFTALSAWLKAHGVASESEQSQTARDKQSWPESQTPLEHDLLSLLNRVASPAAIDALLQQPARWQQFLGSRKRPQALEAEAAQPLLRHADALDRLVHGVRIAVVGLPNAGKSTLTNALLGREVALVSDQPGTTRDHVERATGLHTPIGDITVQWLDTPGQRPIATDAVRGPESVQPEPIHRAEAHALALATVAIESADVIVALAEPHGDWPVLEDRHHQRALFVRNKSDQIADIAPANDPDSTTSDSCPADLYVSARTGDQLDELQRLIVERLTLPKPEALATLPWAFSPTLRAWLDGKPMPDGYLAPI